MCRELKVPATLWHPSVTMWLRWLAPLLRCEQGYLGSTSAEPPAHGHVHKDCKLLMTFQVRKNSASEVTGNGLRLHSLAASHLGDSVPGWRVRNGTLSRLDSSIAVWRGYSPWVCMGAGSGRGCSPAMWELGWGGGAQGPRPGTHFSGAGLWGQWLRSLSSGARAHVPSMPGLECGGRRQAPGLGRQGIPQNHHAPCPSDVCRSILASPPWAQSLPRAAWERPCSSTPSIIAPSSVCIERKRAFSGYVSQAFCIAFSCHGTSSLSCDPSDIFLRNSVHCNQCAGGSLDLMVTMALPTAFSTCLLQELPKESFPRPRFGLKSLSDPTWQLVLKWLKGARDLGTQWRGAQRECPGLSVFLLEEI